MVQKPISFDIIKNPSWECRPLVEGRNPENFENGLIGGIGNVHRRWYLNRNFRDRYRNFRWEQRWGTDDGGFGGGSAFYENKRNENCYGAGGGFTGGHNIGRYDIDGGGDGSFSADPEADFDNHYVEYGYCKIERIDEWKNSVLLIKI